MLLRLFKAVLFMVGLQLSLQLPVSFLEDLQLYLQKIQILGI